MVGAQSRQGVSLGFVQGPSSSRPNPFSPLLLRLLSLLRFAIVVVSSSCFTSCHSLPGQATCAIALFYSNYYFFFFFSIPSNYSLPGHPVALNFDHHLFKTFSSPLLRNVSQFSRPEKDRLFATRCVSSPGFACGVHVASLLLLPPKPRFTWLFCNLSPALLLPYTILHRQSSLDLRLKPVAAPQLRPRCSAFSHLTLPLSSTQPTLFLPGLAWCKIECE